MGLIKIKQKLTKNSFGRFVIKVYHYLVAVPLSFLCLFFSKFKKRKTILLSFYTYDETFALLADGKKSLSRFGDGEIAWMFGKSKGYFGQENSKELSQALQKAILSENPNLLVGVPNFFGDMAKYSEKRRRNRDIHLSKFYKYWKKVLKSDKKYVDALISRVYNGRDDINHLLVFNQWKSVWRDKRVIVVEGKQTRFGVGNDLLAQAKSVRRILCPSENAFAKYNSILNECLTINDADLFLLALGPTASVLSSDLCDKNLQAIDIGHLDIEYEWFLKGTNDKQPVAGKYVNEAGGYSSCELSDDVLEKYRGEVLAAIE